MRIELDEGSYVEVELPKDTTLVVYRPDGSRVDFIGHTIRLADPGTLRVRDGNIIYPVE